MSPPQSLMIPFDSPLENGLSKEPSLAQQLLQITSQKGPFRNITEQSILAEESGQDADANANANADGDGDGDADEETPQQRLEKLWASRELMTKQWSRGLDELLTSLDFLSLLLSKQSAAAKASISEGLNAQRVPPGSLEAKVIQAQAPLPWKEQRDAQVARGWKAKGFELAHGKFAAASTRLKKEAEREALFWAETARLQQDGWKISRHPRDSKAIGIHIGMCDSAPHFRARGFDLLRQDDNGRVYLDKADQSSDPKKRLHVAIEKQGRICGSAVADVKPDPASDSTSSSITSQSAALARDSLLEEELFYEACREARLISKQGITVTRAQTITFSLDGESKVILSYDSPPEPRTPSHSQLQLQSQTQTQSQSQSHDGIAQGIRICLKSLFIEALEGKQARRRQKPGPISSRAKANPELSILRPLIASMRHQAAVNSLQKQVQTLFQQPFRRAGLALDFTLDSAPASPSTFLPGGRTHSQTQTQTQKSIAVLTLPDRGKVSIQIESSLDPPIYGIRYQTELVDFGFAKVAELGLSNEDGLLEAVRRILSLEVVSLILRTGTRGCSDSGANGDESASAPGKWQVKLAQKGEMEYIRPVQRQKPRAVPLKARVQVLPGSVVLAFLSSSSSSSSSIASQDTNLDVGADAGADADADVDAGPEPDQDRENNTGRENVVMWTWTAEQTRVRASAETETDQQADKLSILEVVAKQVAG